MIGAPEQLLDYIRRQEIKHNGRAKDAVKLAKLEPFCAIPFAFVFRHLYRLSHQHVTGVCRDSRVFKLHGALRRT